MNNKRFWIKSYDDHVSASLNYPKKDMASALIEGLKRVPNKVGFYLWIWN